MAVYSGSFRQQMTIVEIIIADLHCLYKGGCCVGLCVFMLTAAVNAVCAGEQCTCQTCVRALYSDSLRPSALVSEYVISTANTVLQHHTHVIRE